MRKWSVLKRFTKTGRSNNDTQNYGTKHVHIMSPVAAGHSKRLHRTQSADPHSQTSQWGTTTPWSSPYTNMDYSSSVLVHAGLYCQPSVTHMMWFSRMAKSILMFILAHGCWFDKMIWNITHCWQQKQEQQHGSVNWNQQLRKGRESIKK